MASASAATSAVVALLRAHPGRVLAVTGAAVGLLTVATIVTVLVSANFNILNWME